MTSPAEVPAEPPHTLTDPRHHLDIARELADGRLGE
jgi:hypothetical protein